MVKRPPYLVAYPMNREGSGHYRQYCRVGGYRGRAFHSPCDASWQQGRMSCDCPDQ